MIIWDAELQGVEIPSLQPSLGVAGVTFGLGGAAASPGCLELCHPSLGRHCLLKLLFHNCQIRGD